MKNLYVLHILNEALTKYGFTKELKCVEDGFHGHQRGVAICLRGFDPKNNNLPHVIENYLPDAYGDKDANLREILNDPNIVKLYQRVNHMEGDQIIPRELVYVPFYVANHSCFMPTLNFDNVDPEGNTPCVYVVDIELLFVCDGMNRYITFHTLLNNVSIWDATAMFFERRMFVEAAGGKFTSDKSEEFTLDFYTEVGEKVILTFPSLGNLRDHMVSFRLINIGESDASAKATQY